MILAPGASTKPYIRSVRVNGKQLRSPILTHDQVAHGGLIEFVMSDKPEAWGSSTVFVGAGSKTFAGWKARNPQAHVEL